MSALTEEEAKTKWCFKTAGAHPDDERGRTCLASQCMAWRWARYDEYVFDSAGIDWSKPDTTVKTETLVKNTAPHTGFCGLVGQS